jgi:hypothetical protein
MGIGGAKRTHATDLDIAEREHHQATTLMVASVRSVPEAVWHRARFGRTWTIAEELSHVLLALDFGARAAEGTMQMREQRPALVSALSRAVLIPILLRSGRFPSGGVSPSEVDPMRHRQFSVAAGHRDSALLAFEQGSERTEDAFRQAAEQVPARRIIHPYFGGLQLLTGWRLLSAHTRHHAAMLGRRD